MLMFLTSMKGSDPAGLVGPSNPLPDFVQIHDPPVEKPVAEPTSEQREPAIVPAPVPAPAVEEQATYQQAPDPYAGGYDQPAAF